MTHWELFPVCVHRQYSTASPSAAIVSKIQQATLVLPTRVAGKEIYMETKKFTAEYRRLCRSYVRCADCPLNGKCIPPSHDYIHRFVSILNVVEDWSAAHPITKRADLFIQTHPHAVFDRCGSLLICPVVVDKTFTCPLHGNCERCRKNYWLKEVQDGR